MLGWGSDSFVLALVKGASEVAIYAVAFRLFQFASQPFAIMNAPLWAAYADAHARFDTRFIRQALKRSLFVSAAGSAVISAVLVAAGPWLIASWTRSSIVVPEIVLLLFGIWTVLDATGGAFGAYLNGCGIVKEQVFVVLLFCAVVLPLKLWLGSSLGAAGLLAASIGAYVVVIIGMYGVALRARVLAPLGGVL
jgi:O-antigen/teichoic acid export membrane protein